jgi:hypothetical protein
MLTIALATGGAALLAWFGWRRRVVVPCELDLEATHEHFHAHVALEGLLPNPGDAVQVEAAPTSIVFGERRSLRSSAQVRRASWPRRQWTRLTGRLQFYELYDVGFE